MTIQTTIPAEERASSPAALRIAWEQAFGSPPPRGAGKDLLGHALSWREQADAIGGMPKGLARELDRLAKQLERSGDLDIERQPRLKRGTRLVREWHGRTYQVTVVRDGYLFEDQHFSSLSVIAQVITGVKWSGPRFFGLKQTAVARRQGERPNG